MKMQELKKFQKSYSRYSIQLKDLSMYHEQQSESNKSNDEEEDFGVD